MQTEMKKKKTRTHDNSSKYYKLFVFAFWFISSRVKNFRPCFKFAFKNCIFTEIYGYIGTLLGNIYSVNARGS